MNKIVRAAAPICLTYRNNYRKKGRRWQTRYASNPNAQFSWGTFRSQKMSLLIINALSPMTNNHCSFCDKNNVIKGGDRPTIEHYKPKTRWPLLSFVWNNLFLCCYQCQEYKNNEFHNELIKPDRISFDFDHYFIIDFATGNLFPNPAYPQNIPAAQETIRIYGLNEDARPILRKKEVDAFNNTIVSARNIENFSYRFFILKSIP